MPTFATNHLWLISDHASAGIRALQCAPAVVPSTRVIATLLLTCRLSTGAAMPDMVPHLPGMCTVQ